MAQQKRLGLRVQGAHMDEVQAETISLPSELVQRVQLGFSGAPVIISRPIA